MKKEFDVIRLENLETVLEHGNYYLQSDVFVNNKKFRGFCDLLTFLEDSHKTPKNQFYDPMGMSLNHVIRPMKNDPFHTPYKVRQNMVKELDLEDIRSLSPIKRKSAKKRNKKKLKNLFLDKKYQERRVTLNKSYLIKDKLSNCYLNSCDCGIPSCSGVYNGVQIIKKKEGILYRSQKEFGYNNGILGSGKLDLFISNENIKELRKQIDLEHKKAKKDFYDKINQEG